MADSGRLMRNAFNTIFYHVRDTMVEKGWLVSGTFSGIATLIDAFPTSEDLDKIVLRENSTGEDDEVFLPVVAIDDTNYVKVPIQIGGGEAEARALYGIMVFAEDDSQKRDIGNQLYNAFFEQTIDLLDYTGGYPPSVVPSGYGAIEFNSVRYTPVRNFDSPNTADKFAGLITFDALIYESQ